MLGVIWVPRAHIKHRDAHVCPEVPNVGTNEPNLFVAGWRNI